MADLDELIITISNDTSCNKKLTVDLWDRGASHDDQDVLIEHITLDSRLSVTRYVSDDVYIVIRKKQNDA